MHLFLSWQALQVAGCLLLPSAGSSGASWAYHVAATLCRARPQTCRHPEPVDEGHSVRRKEVAKAPHYKMNFDHLAPYLTLANVAATVISALAAAFSGWAAWRSAGSARDAEKRADQAEFRSAYKDVALVAMDCSVARSKIRNLVPELSGALKMSQVVRGVRSDSYTDLSMQAANASLSKAEQLTAGLDGFIGGNLAGKVTTIVEAHQAQIRWGAALVELHASERNLVDELAKTRRVTADAAKARSS